MEEQRQFPAKKQEIINWAYDRFYDGGFHATGIDAIMAGSGISKRSLYKYFSSKEDLIEAVLDQYGEVIAGTLFAPVLSQNYGAQDQIIALFDARKTMMEDNPIRGCLGIKASQEYVGGHEGIFTRGKGSAVHVENIFVSICERGRFADPKKLGKQITILFQGAVLLAQVYGESSPFMAAKDAALRLMHEQTE